MIQRSRADYLARYTIGAERLRARGCAVDHFGLRSSDCGVNDAFEIGRQSGDAVGGGLTAEAVGRQECLPHYCDLGLQSSDCGVNDAREIGSELGHPQGEPLRPGNAGGTPAVRYLTHYTREPEGAWPGEARADYLRWLCGGVPFQRRDAFAALCRILSERLIRGNGRLMPGGAAMSCFTALPPANVLGLRRWRRGLLRWSFTPYAIALRKDAAVRFGCRAVVYADVEQIQNAPAAEREYMQRAVSGEYCWKEEAEWRVRGDVDLSRVDGTDLLALVETPGQAAFISERYSVAAKAI